MQTTKIATKSRNGIRKAPRQDMEKWFFLYRIYMFRNDPAINQADDGIALSISYVANAPLPFAQSTTMGTNRALQFAILSFEVHRIRSKGSVLLVSISHNISI
jgi:hypothetical protein